MPKMEWLLLLPHLPATPSSLRVNVWRRLKDVGATSFQSGAWLLLRTPDNEDYLKRLQLFISENEATSQLFILQCVDESTDQEIIQKFMQDREEEYQEVLEQCKAYKKEVREEIESGILTFIELEDNEQKYKRLEKWIAKIRKRDFLVSKVFEKVRQECQTSRKLLQEYAKMIYEKEGIEIENGLPNITDDELLTGFGDSG
jgi:hypothetical protein